MFIRLLVFATLLHGACAGAASLVAPNTYLIAGEATPNGEPDGNSIARFRACTGTTPTTVRNW